MAAEEFRRYCRLAIHFRRKVRADSAKILNLSPSVLNALIRIKSSLLETSSEDVAAKELEDPLPLRAEVERKTPERTMRRARVRGFAYQKYKRWENAR